MTDCSSDETLARLLADQLSASERDAVAEHVQACLVCQATLARHTENAESALLPRGDRVAARSEAEEEIVRKLKRRRSAAVSAIAPADTTITDLLLRQSATLSVRDSKWPSVPGYEIAEMVGHGGMAVVFKARQLALQRVVALKMLRSGSHAGEKELARFRVEAEIIARLQHPNIVQIYDVGEVGGRPYFVLEYVPGGNLAQCLNGTPMSVRSAAQFVEVLSRAVQAAHANGVVHRDLKPANILLVSNALSTAAGTDGARHALLGDDVLTAVPKIADFGVAKCALDDRERHHNLTVAGDLLGTPSYMAPEQAATTGIPVGPPADIYALGAILYELLTGRPPFKGQTQLDTVLQVLHSEPVSVTSLQPNVPRDLETICHKCLQKDPLERYATASELADDLQSFLRGAAIKARPRSTAEKARNWILTHPALSGLVAAGVIAPIIALIVLSLLSARLVRSSALESAAQQADLLEHATNAYSEIVQRVEAAHYAVNKMVPPTPDTVPLSIPATFLHDVGEDLHRDSTTGVQVRQYSDYPFPWRKGGGPQDEFERQALLRLRETNGQDTVHDFTEIDGEPVVRYAQARIMKQSCVDCHNTHPFSARKDWKVGDVRGVLEIIRPLKNDEARISQTLRLTLLLSALGSATLLLGSVLALWTTRRRRMFAYELPAYGRAK